ncbi:EST1-DNA-bind domain-containing protein [Fusarium keratoplasticum]|uniref:EST1-DNA-bind domain-containing protein n=1 Tax=Fusarium keratoplasticum TaxID=1328300 RepID=A0ACC0RBK1_9HYPO|nr:EST1-DNA-bind domain-containing protein [Fusarium keratoplasticum]KAI8680008.1 EST1-DNA-bind domain-containing protein [Fusarium keratoplasticum]
MDNIADKWVGYLRNRDRQDKGGGPNSFPCPECNLEVGNSLESWRSHVASDPEHQQRWPTEQEVENTFNQYVQQTSAKPDASLNNRKRQAGETPASNNIAEPDDTREAKRRSPPPTNPQTPSSPSNNRSRARNDPRIDQGRPHKNTSGRQLWTSEDGIPSKTPQNQGRAVPIASQRQPPSNQNNPITAPQSSPQPGQDDDNTSVMIPQPETRPISQDQLVAEVKGIYAGLVMVETKCIEVDNAQSSNAESNPKLNNDQWQALIALHRTLLHEHHDFFLASQHPSASPALRRLASKYAMPARMWRHGIHSFLELLRHRLPASLEHMLTFLYLAYSIVALLYETVPAFEDTWIECLGDLGRYRMAIEDDCIRDRETWTGVSRHWYSKASDKSPTTGRLYHHLAILARPNALQQLSYYTKSLCVLIPFPSARESIMTLFDPVLSKSPNRLAPIDAAFVRVHGILFSGKSKDRLEESMDEFIGQLDSYIGRVTKRWLDAGYYIGISTGCSLLGYGSESNLLMRAMSQKPEDNDVAMDGSSIVEANPDETFKQALDFAVRIIETVMRRWGDTNTLPFLHTVLVFMNHMTRFPGAISHIEGAFPWKLTSLMLNSLLVSCEAGYEVHSDFRRPERELPRPLPEDFAMRGLIYSEDYFPSDWFKNDKIDEDEKYFELGSMVEERKDRILSLGCKMATSGSWLIWNPDTRQFTVPAKYDVELEDVPA